RAAPAKAAAAAASKSVVLIFPPRRKASVGLAPIFVKSMSCMLLITGVNVADLDLNLLRVFDAVLQQRSVTAAAARLGLTQPAVSNALARLRALFGDALFVRTPAGMEATPFARG